MADEHVLTESENEEEGSEDFCCARRAHESVMIGSKMYVFGGYRLHGYQDHEVELRRQTVFSYDIITREWTRHTTMAESGSDMPLPCTGAKSAAIGRVIYSFGGLAVSMAEGRRFSNATYALDTASMTWRCCKANGDVHPTGRDKCSLCVDGSRLLIFGGWSLRIDKKRLQPGAVWVPEEDRVVGWNNELYAFDTQTETWLPLETYGTRPSPRAAHTMNKIDDYRVIVFGGRQPERRMNDIHILNLKTMTWSGPILPTGDVGEFWPSARSLHTMSTVSQSPNVTQKLPGQVILLGGMNADGDCCEDDAWILNVDETKWGKLCSEGKAVRRTWHTTCGVYSTGGYTELYTFGGSPDNIWQTGSRDLHGPAIFTCGVKGLYRTCMEAVEKHRARLKLSICTLPRSIQEEFWARYGRSSV